jgi:hypothetical protein
MPLSYYWQNLLATRFSLVQSLNSLVIQFQSRMKLVGAALLPELSVTQYAILEHIALAMGLL